MIPKQVSLLLFIIIPLIICNLLYIDLCKSSTKNDISPKPKKYSSKKLKENNDNNIKFNNSIIDNHNNMKCINVNIIDSGNENIDAKIAMNCDNKFNYVMGNFYLPTYKRSKLLFCGEGQSIIVKDLKINNYDKDDPQAQQFETIFSLEQKSCTCCNII